MTTLKMIFMDAAHDRIFRLVILMVVCDTFFGVLRALKEHKFNSSIGINGAIRKVGMLLSLVFLSVFDALMQFNLIGLIPEDIRIAAGVTFVGTLQFFGLLYIAYEEISILKNMFLCGLPVRQIWEAVYKFLYNYTTELPDPADAEEENQKDEHNT